MVQRSPNALMDAQILAGIFAIKGTPWTFQSDCMEVRRDSSGKRFLAVRLSDRTLILWEEDEK